MSIRVAVRFVSASLLITSFSAGCGDDEADGTGGGGGAGGATTSVTAVTSSGSTTSAVTTSTSAGTGGEGGGGEGGAGTGGDNQGGGDQGGGGTGGAPACVGELPAAYDGADFATNAAPVLAFRAQLGALNSAMAAAETDPEGDLNVLAADLVTLFEAGDPSLSDGMTSYYDGIVREVFTAYEAASGNVWQPALPVMGPGGKFGPNIFDASGRDLRQWVEKGHFNSFFFPHAISLVEAGLTAETVDQLLASYGAHPDFPGDSSADTATNPDRLIAQYAERRSPKNTDDPSLPLDPEAPGTYFVVKNDFILLQAAVAGGCDEEADAAAARILAAWERDAMAATVVYYLADSIAKLTADGATDVQLAQGLHGVGEATAFLHGFAETPAAHRTMTDAQLAGLLDLLGQPTRFVVDSLEVSDLTAVVDELATIYGFDAGELEAFETNH